MKQTIVVFLVFTFCCNITKKKITINLDNYAFNRLPLPDEIEMNAKVVKKDFELKLNETYTYRNFNFDDLMKGKIDTTFPYYPIKIKKGNVNFQSTCFQIGLIDENRNDLYTDIGIDKLIFLPKNTDSIYYDPTIYSSVALFDKTINAKINESFYKIESQNDKVLITIEKEQPDSIHCIFNSKIPALVIQDEKGNEKSLTDLKEKNKNLIVELWFDGCRGCIKVLPKLKKIDTVKNTIVSLNVIDKLNIIEDFKIEHEILWPMIKSNKRALNELGNLGNYPSAVVYDEKGDLIEFSKTY